MIFESAGKYIRPVSFLTKHVLLVIAGLVLAMPYLHNNPPLLIIAACAVSLIIKNLSTSYHESKMFQMSDHQLLWLLEYLASCLASGHTLEYSFIRAYHDLKKLPPGYEQLERALRQLNYYLGAQIDLETSLDRFLDSFGSYKAVQYLGSLPVLRIHGANLEIYIENCFHMLRDQITIENEIKAEQSGKAAEVMILCLAPFALSSFLTFGSRDYSRPLNQTEYSVWLNLLIFSITWAAILLAGKIALSSNFKLSNVSHRRQKLLFTYVCNSKISGYPNSNLHRFVVGCCTKCWPVYYRLLPISFRSRLVKQLELDAGALGIDYEKISWSFIRAKFIYLILVMITLAACSFAVIELVFIIPPALFLTALLHDYNFLKNSEIRQQQYRMLFPVWLNLLTNLLSSGLSLHKALQIASKQVDMPLSETNKAGIKAANYFNYELVQICRGLDGGSTSSQLIEILSSRVPLPQIRAALYQIIRYEKDGGNNLLQIIQLHAGSCWQLYKNAIRRRLQKKSVLYLLPMSLDLTAILATAMLPALVSLKAF